MAHDATTFNAFQAGAFAGGLGAFISDATAADYLALSNAALAVATEFDNLLFAGAGAGANAQRGFLAAEIARAVFSGRTPLNMGIQGAGSPGPNPATAANWAGVAAAAVAAYTEGILNFA